MRLAILLCLLLFTMTSWAQLSIKSNGVTIQFKGALAEDFEVLTIDDTTFIRRLTYEGLAGQEITISEEPSIMTISYELGFSQYTIDDSPAAPLSFSRRSEEIRLEGDHLPELYNTRSERRRAQELLGFATRDALAEKIFQDHFDEIKKQSLSHQASFFEKVVSDDQYVECCPEYIEQALSFLNKSKDEFQTLQDLSIELIYKSTIVTIEFGESEERVVLKIH